MTNQNRLQNLEAIFFDFDGVLTDNKVAVFADGSEMVTCCRSDGLAFDYFKQVGLPIFIISTETHPVVGARGKKLGVTTYQGVSNKAQTIKKICSEYGFDLMHSAFIGNDINDLGAMRLCGYKFCPSDSHEAVKQISDKVLKTKGGNGVARELLEEVLCVDLSSELYKTSL